MKTTISESDRLFLKSISVLYVEDDAEIHRQLSEYLTREVGTLHTAPNGRAGLEVFEEIHPEVVVTDILMPEMDGLEMAKMIREKDPDVPIIVTTAFNDEEFFLRAIEIGIESYVRKPTIPRDLVQAILKSARLLREKRKVIQANRYTNFVLDIHPSFLMVVAGGKLEYINKAFLEFLGFSSLSDFLRSDVHIQDFLVDQEGGSLSRLKEGEWVGYLLKSQGETPIIYMKAPGESECMVRPFAVSVNTLPDESRHIFSLSDIARIENQIKQLEKRAFTDSLTGACNRAKLQGNLEAEIKRSIRHGGTLSVVLFDVDHFKQINDTYGHQAGDDVLVALVSFISKKLRASDLLARWGGEEFIMVLPEVGVQDAILVSDKIRKNIENNNFPKVGRLTISFGVTQFREGDTPKSLIERADRFLYQAKNSGRNRVEGG
ncbi:MAG: diguanylate cyclase [Magnetococcales bacterium]|nr:diguanylate cyclase [Magnetococcales bacterium]